jgi:hypothetical protein
MQRSTKVPRAYLGAVNASPKNVDAGQFVADAVVPDTVLFIIGMRINRWRRVRSWWPVVVAMPRMLKELSSSNAGLLNAETFWRGRVFAVIQYWRSAEELGAYSRDNRYLHAPAWGAFNKQAAATGDVGIFHETYVVRGDAIESVYGNMVPFGLAKAYGWVPRAQRRGRTDAHHRLPTTEPDFVEQHSG